jgi:flavorubredoxin
VLESTEVSVSSSKLSGNIIVVRVDDRHTKFFEGIWYIPEGVTYNSYIVIGEDRVALLDTTRVGLEELFIDEIKKYIDIRDIDVIVVHHAEQDHSGALLRLLELNKRAKVYASPLARRILEHIYASNLGDRFVPVKSGTIIRLGSDINLTIETTPWLHWPETIMSFLEPYNVLFSGDVFGSYGIPSSYTDKHINGLDPTYLIYMRKYFATVVSHYKEHVKQVIAKLKSKRIIEKTQMIAPLHGLVIERNISTVLGLYEKWADERLDFNKAVIVVSTSYGTVLPVVANVKAWLEKHGVKVSVFWFNSSYHTALSDVLGEAYDAGLIILIASTYEGKAHPTVYTVLNLLCSKITRKRPALVLSSYGWSGGAKDLARTAAKCLDIRATYEFPGRAYDLAKLNQVLKSGLSTT